MTWVTWPLVKRRAAPNDGGRGVPLACRCRPAEIAAILLR